MKASEKMSISGTKASWYMILMFCNNEYDYGQDSEKQVEVLREDCLQIMFLILGRVGVFL